MHRRRHMATHWGSRVNVSGVRRSYPQPTKKDAVMSQQKERGRGGAMMSVNMKEID